MIEAQIRVKMQQVVDLVTSDIGSIRTGRAAPSLVENLAVAVYGGAQKLKIQELATISSPDPSSLVIDPWDKSIIGEIAKGMMAANVGLNPAIDGEVLRINIPPMTFEDREGYIKILSQRAEAGRVMIRNVRAEAMKEVDHAFEAKEFGEDDKFAKEKEVQAITDEFVEKIDELAERKKQELLQV